MINPNQDDTFRAELGRGGIDPTIFFRESNRTPKFHSDKIPVPIFSLQSKLCGPSTVWEIFKKQQEVLDYVVRSNLSLLPFTYQNKDGTRLFLAAHPENFWFKDEQRKPGERHSYEIIQENKSCKLYFDLEFETLTNKHHSGNRMVNTFIELVCTALRNKYGLTCRFSDVLILDSSSPTKFSCHLIFPNVIFENNYHVGSFVKDLCYEVKMIGLVSNLHLLKDLQPCVDIQELTVLDSKNGRKFFCDEGVYTKNRHFRLYKSSKFEKNVVLKMSENCQFDVGGIDTKSRERNIFLCSLITYYSSAAVILTYENVPVNEVSPVSVRRCIRPNRRSCESNRNPFVEIDGCIGDIVRPGSIYRSRYYPEKRILVYDIVGNRYCANIGRQHKSNNIKYVVDVNTLSYYQRCYDPDCADFRSASFKLPVDESIFINHDIDDEDFLLLPLGTCSPRNAYCSYRDTGFASTDDEEDLVEATERCELLNRSRGKLLFFQDADDDLMAYVAEECEKSNACDAEHDLLMVAAAEKCESLILTGKRKLSEHLADEESTKGSIQKKNDDTERYCDRRKVIRTSDFMFAIPEDCNM